jgi:hypothetical protein
MSLQQIKYTQIQGGMPNVKNFGADSTGSVDSTSAFIAALAASNTVHVPAGVYLISSTITLTAGKKLFGENRNNTTIVYTGSGSAFFCGSVTPGAYYDIQLKDFTLECSNKVTPVTNGILMNWCVHFLLENLTITGPMNPNLAEPLVGNGLNVTMGSFIGKINHVDSRLWDAGIKLAGGTGSANEWVAAIELSGQGELQNNNDGLVLGANAGYSDCGGVTVRDYTIEGNYNVGLYMLNGYSVTIDAVYFETNGNYDIQIGAIGLAGNPIGTRILNCNASSGNLGATPYGVFNYVTKIIDVTGIFTTIANNMTIADSVPNIQLSVGTTSAYVYNNRVQSLLPTANRIANASTSSTLFKNYGYTVNYSVTPTLLNSWVDNGLGYAPTRYYTVTNQDGQTIVYLEGAVKSGVLGTTVFTLPLGLRPINGRLDFVCGAGAGANSVAILTNGDVVTTTLGATPLSLTGIFFYTS